MSQPALRRLRPYLFTGFKRSTSHTSRRALSQAFPVASEQSEREKTNDYKNRVAQLTQARGQLSECYPRLAVGLEQRTSIEDFRTRYDGLKADGTDEKTMVTVAGILQTLYTASALL